MQPRAWPSRQAHRLVQGRDAYLERPPAPLPRDRAPCQDSGRGRAPHPDRRPRQGFALEPRGTGQARAASREAQWPGQGEAPRGAAAPRRGARQARESGEARQAQGGAVEPGQGQAEGGPARGPRRGVGGVGQAEHQGQARAAAEPRGAGQAPAAPREARQPRQGQAPRGAAAPRRGAREAREPAEAGQAEGGAGHHGPGEAEGRAAEHEGGAAAGGGGPGGVKI
ncbi:hypothetical protein DFJ74DRAFT_725909, partial [Hyaloraphidium curvatum]